LKQFVIPIAGIDAGLHQYDFDIDSKFFENNNESEIRTCKIHVRLDLLKNEDMLLLRFIYSGTVELQCDRCLDLFDMPLLGDDEVILKYGKTQGKPKGEEEFISNDQQEIEVRQYIFDFITLNIPFRKVHPDDEQGNSLCDPEAIRKIEELSNTSKSDPRWDQLKDIQIN
jgi:uncharacterized protein